MPLRNNTARLCLIAVLTAMALAVQWLESLLPPIVPAIPVRIGLANLFTLFALLRLSRMDALCVSALRCLLFPLVAGSVSGLAYAAAGSLLSWGVMALLLPLWRAQRVSAVTLSVAGAFLFNVGQLAVGLYVAGPALIAYLPYMGLLSIPAGLATGLIAELIHRRLPSFPKSARS